MLYTLKNNLCIALGFPRRHSGKETACQCRKHKRCRFDPWDRKILWESTSVFMPGKFQGQKNLVGYSQEGHKSAGPDWVTKTRHNLHSTEVTKLTWTIDNHDKNLLYTR